MNFSRVYFIQSERGGPIKIGRAINPEQRLKQCQTGSPERLVLLAVISGGRDLERSLHARFAASRLRGEWFKPTPELIALIGEVGGKKESRSWEVL